MVWMIPLGCEKPASQAEATNKAETEHPEVTDVKPKSKKKDKLATRPTGVPARPRSEPTPVDTSSFNLSSKSTPSPTPVSSSEKPELNLDTNALKDVSKPSANNTNKQPGELAEQVITLTPVSLDLGQFSTSEKVTGSVTLTNTGESPVTIERAKASCGCTTSDFRPGTVLKPGESTEVSVTMNGKGRARKLSKTVTFTITGHSPLRLPVVAETISYVNLDKEPLTIAEDDGISTITLTSLDNEPFTVTSILPAIAVELPTESSATQVLEIDWQKFWDVVQTTKISIRLDHPLCSDITTNVRLTADQRKRLNEIIKLKREGGDLPTKDPTRPLTGDQLARYIKSGRGKQVIKYINDGLGKYNSVDRSGSTILSIAAEAGDVETTQALIELGAQVERVDRVNRTPLMYAARSKKPETIQILLDAGADIQMRDRLGNTPLSWAAGFGVPGGVQILIDAGADANTVDTVLGYTPLLWASGFGDSKSIPILIEADADVNVNDIAEGRSPLMHAVRTGNEEGVEILLGAGANVNDIDNSKSTALHIGAGVKNVSLDKIKLLIEAGADPNLKNNENKTALDLSKGRTDDEGIAIAEYLSTKTKVE